MTVTTTQAPSEADTVGIAVPTAAGTATDVTDRSLVEGELLVEDVSIDGMCGVY